MKKDKKVITAFCLNFVEGIVIKHDGNIPKDVKETVVKKITEGKLQYALTSVREYSTKRNKLIRVIKSFSSKELLQILNTVAKEFECVIINEIITTLNEFVINKTTKEFLLDKAVKEFKMITIGRI